MSLRFPKCMGLTIFLLVGAAATGQSQSPRQASAQNHAQELRVCADPVNMPFSNRAQQGFENRIAELVSQDLHERLTYEWQRMDRGFVRDYLNKSQCDLLIGVPSGYGPVLTTTPYYRSTFVFVVRRDSKLKPVSLNDPALRQMKKIGIQALDEDYTPPGGALARRGLQNEIVGFDTMGVNPDSIIRAVADRQVDAAIVWGPLAGYFAKKYGSTLKWEPVTPEMDPPGIPFTFSISMGVRKGNTELRDRIENVLLRRQADIQKILISYGVPQLEIAPQAKMGD